MGFVALYFLIIFLGLGIGGYFILQKEFPASDPLKLLNSYLLFAILGDLIFRYLLQKLPIMNIKPLLILPIKRNKLVHYVLGKSAFSVFNILGLFFYIPFSFVLIKEGYNTVGVLGWLFSLVLSIQSANLLNFLINKNNKYLIVIAIILLILVCLHRFGFANIIGLEGSFFDFIYQYPIYSILGIMVLALLYLANYNLLRKQVYLDETVQAKEIKKGLELLLQ
ncbi:DUF5687 family protein [Polaribacter sp.]|nr:DUF5687 family protein [Polaribacter sp.]